MWAGVAALVAALPGAMTAATPDTLHLRPSGVEVPFVAQGPLLCGGAAAAMVERFWGARGVYGEDFQHLVRESEGGIRASALTSAMRDRGYDVDVVTGDPEGVFAALDRGVPPILLLESGVTRLHYVVLVEVDDRNAWIHDPNFGPRRRLSRESLARRWAASDGWAMLAVPAAGTDPSTPGRDDPARAPVDAGAEPAVTPTPALAEALERLRNDDPAGARSAASALVQQGGADARLGRRVLATSWFLDGEPARALAEWNTLGEPVVDLVIIDGLAGTRHHVAADRMSLEYGRVLTPRSLGLARRRLAQLPAVEASRIAYRPLPDGTVEVQASVVERSRLPGPRALAAQGARGVASERAALEFGPLVAGGDRWRVMGSWASAQRYLGWSMSAPAPPLPGVATVGMEWRRERFGRAAAGAGTDTPREISIEKRSRGYLGIEEWVHPRLRLGAALALESWKVPGWALDPAAFDDPARLGNLELTAHWAAEDDRSWFTLGGAGWTGAGRSFGRASMEAGADVPHGTWREWRLRAGATAVSRESPRTLWPGAGTDNVRDPLLRAHGLVEDGAIVGPALGRELLYGTVEHRVFRGIGPFRIGAALFVDAAHARRRGAGEGSGTFVDVGAGLFAGMGSREGAVNLARGASGWRLSVQVGSAP